MRITCRHLRRAAPCVQSCLASRAICNQLDLNLRPGSAHLEPVSTSHFAAVSWSGSVFGTAYAAKQAEQVCIQGVPLGRILDMLRQEHERLGSIEEGLLPMRADSVKRKRKTKMNKHKHRKRKKQLRHKS